MPSSRSWAFRRKQREHNCLLSFVTFAWRKMPPLAIAGTKISIWVLSTKWAEKDFVLYVEGACSVRNKLDKLMLKISVFAIGRNLQFFNCHNFCKLFRQTSIDRIFIPMVWFNRNYVSRALEKFCPRASSTFIAGASLLISWMSFLEFSTWSCRRCFDVGWETNMAQSQSSIWLILWCSSKRVWHMCLILEHITSNCCFQFWFAAKFFPQNRNCE